MKIVLCRICGDLIDKIGSTPITCQCGNVVTHYWEDNAHFTIAVQNPPFTVALYGYNTLWYNWKTFRCVFKSSHPISYSLSFPFLMMFQLWLWARINGRICWVKPLEQAICNTKIGEVSFYTYD